MKKQIFISALFSLSAYAGSCCDCIEPGAVKTEVNRASAVVLGKVIAHDTVVMDTATNYEQGYGYWRFKILVKTKYKGNIQGDTITVMTPIGESACGIEFRIGQDYIIYGSAWIRDKKTRRSVRLGENIFWTNSCFRTKETDPSEIEGIKKAIGG